MPSSASIAALLREATSSHTLAAADRLHKSAQAVINGASAADLIEMADLTRVLVSKEELDAISRGDVHVLAELLNRIMRTNGVWRDWGAFPSIPLPMLDNRLREQLGHAPDRQTELAPGEPGYIIQQLRKLTAGADGFSQVVSGDGQNPGNAMWVGNQAISNDVNANEERYLRTIRDRMGPAPNPIACDNVAIHDPAEAPMRPEVERLKKGPDPLVKGPLGSKKLGRFENVPQPLRIRSKLKTARVLTSDEALHRTMLSKNHQQHLAKLDAKGRERFQRAFKRRWVGTEPFHLTKVDLAKLDRRPFNVDEGKVAALMKNPPGDDGNHPIIGDNPSRSDHAHLILDGNHRVEAALRRGDRHLKAYVKACCVDDLRWGAAPAADEDEEDPGESFESLRDRMRKGGLLSIRDRMAKGRPTFHLTPEAAKYLRGLEGSKGGCHADEVEEKAKRLASGGPVTMAHIKAAEGGMPLSDLTLASIAEAFGVVIDRDESGNARVRQR